MTVDELTNLLENLGINDLRYDIRSIESDYENGNVFEDTDFEQYLYTVIVRDSLINGQFTQAKKQCLDYGLEYAIQYHNFKKVSDDE